MNKRANELGMKNTNFENVTGLDDTTVNHKTSALDIAIMSRELIKYEEVIKYSSLWQDTIRDGEFTLTNTNRLVRYYDGCNGLKTGSTAKAGFCVSATAKRDGMQLIAVIMGAESRDERNSSAKKLLDYGFSNFTLYRNGTGVLEEVEVNYGKTQRTPVSSNSFSIVIEKGRVKDVEKSYDIPKSINAPMKKGDKIGSITYKLDSSVLGYSDIILVEDVEKIKTLDVFLGILKSIIIF